LFKNAGVNGEKQRLVLNFVNTLISAAGALVGTSLCDKVGRRTMWFYGTAASAVMLAIATACTASFGSDGSNPAGARAAVAFICSFSFNFGRAT